MNKTSTHKSSALSKVTMLLCLLLALCTACLSGCVASVQGSSTGTASTSGSTDDGTTSVSAERLPAPTDISYDDTTKTITWAEVPNAESYTLKINDAKTVYTDYPVYIIPGSMFDTDCMFTLSVMACGDGVLYTSSKWSSPVSFEYTVYQGNASDIAEMQRLNLGAGINAITGEYLDLSGLSKNSFLDYNAMKLAGLKLKRVSLSAGQLTSFSAESMREFTEKYAASYSNSSGVSLGLSMGSIFGFTAGLNTKFAECSEQSITEKTKQYYHVSYQTYHGSRAYIVDFEAAASKTSLLNEAVIERLESMMGLTGSDLEREIASLFNDYGTHIIIDAMYGGKIEIYYCMVSNDASTEQINTESLQADINTTINAGIGSVSGNVGVSSSSAFDSKWHLNSSSSEVYTDFKVVTHGGSAFTGTDFGSLEQNYRSWIESFNSQGSKDTMIDITSGGLIPLWSLLPREYADLAQSMRSYFEAELTKCNKEFLDKFEPDENSFDLVGIAKGFAGGDGSAEHPYKISSRAQFEKINSTGINTSDTYFMLTSNIDLGIWNAPFELNGHLSGNGYTVTYTQTVSAASSPAGGLFSVLNGATVRDLHINATIGKTDQSESNNDVNAGGLAGSATGAVTILRVAVSGSMVMTDGHDGETRAGGIVGYYTGGEIRQCYSTMKIVVYRKFAVTGGIVGEAHPTDVSILISDCFNKGTVEAHTAWIYGGRSAGGIVGQGRHNAAFALIISNCYSDADIKIIQDANAALGWWGCGGIIGDIAEGKTSNIFVNRCYWNKSRAELAGNNGTFHPAESKKDAILGKYEGWDEGIWSFSDTAAPQLKWAQK